MVYQAFVYTLLHSIWQAALLAMVMFFYVRLHPKSPALRVKLVATALLLTLFVLSLLTFFYLTTESPDLLESNLHRSFPIPESILVICTWMYIGLVIFQSLRLAIRWQRYARMLRLDVMKAPLDWRLFVQKQSARMGIKQWVQVQVSPHIATVTTYGFWRPVILIPVALLNQLTLAQAETLLLHELAHIRQYDYIWNWIILILERIYFYNPFVLYLIRILREEREFACDDAVLSWQHHPLTYAESLLVAARQSKINAVFALAATGQSEILLERVQHITGTDTRKRNFRLTHNRFTWTALLLLALATGLHYWNQALPNSSPIQPISAFRKNSLLQRPINSTGLPLVLHYSEAATESISDITKVKKSLPLITTSTPALNSIEKDIDRPTSNPYATVASYKEKAATTEDNQIMIMEEENPATGIKVTQAYRVFQEHGEWKTSFLWSIVDSKPAEEMPHESDSCSIEKAHE